MTVASHLRNIVVVAETMLDSSVEAKATVSFDRTCGSQTIAVQDEVNALAVCVMINGNLVIECDSSIGCDIRTLGALSDLEVSCVTVTDCSRTLDLLIFRELLKC